MKNREVRHDGHDGLQVRFPFDRSLVDLVKSLPNRRWNADGRFWHVPDSDVLTVVDLLHESGFRFDVATRALYREMGGNRAVDDGDLPAAAPQPGLFDSAPEPPRAGASTRRDEYTVSSLNLAVRQTLENAFREPVWIVGEIADFDRSRHKRHVHFKLLEREDDGTIRSRVEATLFEDERERIATALRRAGDPFALGDEISVRLAVRVELYIPWGSYRVSVEGLDVSYTLGEAARRREEIVRRLGDEGLLDRNPSLPIPVAPLRVGLVTSLRSDAYEDVLRTLQESRFAFRVTAHDARVQGRATEESVLRALDWLRARAGELDVVLICRGGGSRTDLAWFDSEALGRAVARFPVPVVVGIGHEQDRSVLDSVARRAKTPTAAAGFLVETVREALVRMEACGRTIEERAARRLRDASSSIADRGRRLLLAARHLLRRESAELGHRAARAGRAARGRIAAESERIGTVVRAVPRAAAVRLALERQRLDGTRRAIARGVRRDLETARRDLAERAVTIGPSAARLVQRERERSDARDRRLHLVDPRRVVERGYAILRGASGGVVRGPDQAPAGSAVEAELERGRLRLRSLGAAPDEPREKE